MAKSALERFNAYMNGMDPDTEAEAPEAEINIDVDVKVVEAEEIAEEGAELDAEIEASEAATDMAEEAAEQAEMVAKILREEGLNPGMLSLLKANPIFSDVWNVPMPARESLDATGTNMTYAESIAAALEEKADATKGALAKAWDKLIQWLSDLKAWLKKAFDFKAKNVEKSNANLKDVKVDEAKAKEKKIKIISVADAKAVAKYVDDVTSGKLGSKAPNIEKSEVAVSDIVASFTSGGEYYTAVKGMLDKRDAIGKLIDSTIAEFKNFKKGNTDKEKVESAKKVKEERVSALKALNKTIRACADSFTSGAGAVISCKAKEEKKD